MIISDAKNTDIEDIKKMWDDNFDEDSIEWRKWYFDNVFSIENVIVGKNDDELVSMIHMNPYTMMMREAKIKSFAMAGVATKKKYRGQGYAAKLIKYSLEKAYDVGYEFSFLYPFNYEFYEKYGYSVSYYKYKYETQYNINNGSILKVHERFKNSVFAEIYKKHVQGKNGYVIRDNVFYDKHIKQFLCDGIKVECFSLDKKRGYFFVDEKTMLIEEMAYEGDLNDAIIGITNHYKKTVKLENQFYISHIKSQKEKHCMGRIINVEKLLKKLKFKNVDIKIKISDDIIAANCAAWHIAVKDGKTSINKTEAQADYTIDISQLSSIVTGINMEENGEVTKLQNLLFENTQAFIYEVC